MLDVEQTRTLILGNSNMAFLARNTDFNEADASLIENLLHTALVLVCNLDNQCRVLGEEKFHDILLNDIVEVNLHTAGCICKTHLKECCDETTGRDVVTGHDKTLLHKLLYSIECLGEILRVGNCRNIVTNTVAGLCECRTTQTQMVEAEVYVIECTLRLVDHNRRNHLAHIGNLAAGRYNHCSRADDLCTVRILLRH